MFGCRCNCVSCSVVFPSLLSPPLPVRLPRGMQMSTEKIILLLFGRKNNSRQLLCASLLIYIQIYIYIFFPKDEIEFLSWNEIWVLQWSCQSQMFFLTCLWLHVVMRKTEEWSFNVCQSADCAADSDGCFRGLLNLSSVQLLLFCSCERESRE